MVLPKSIIYHVWALCKIIHWVYLLPRWALWIRLHQLGSWTIPRILTATYIFRPLRSLQTQRTCSPLTSHWFSQLGGSLQGRRLLYTSLLNTPCPPTWQGPYLWRWRPPDTWWSLLSLWKPRKVHRLTGASVWDEGIFLKILRRVFNRQHWNLKRSPHKASPGHL